MTFCTSTRERLLTQDLREFVADAATAAHMESCSECRAAVDAVRAGEYALAASLDAERPQDSAAAIAQRVLTTVHKRRLPFSQFRWAERAASTAAVAFFVVTGALVFSGVVISIVRSYGVRAELPLETFTLSCLSSEQALDLARGYYEGQGGGAWPVRHGLRAITVRASRASLEQFRATLHRVEGDQRTVCDGRGAPLR